MFLKKTLLATALLAFGGYALTASAATQVTNFNVTATVINNCIISSTNIAFGNYDPTATTAVTAAVPVRQMINGANNLPYHIFTASGGTTEWGVGTVGTNEPVAQTSTSVLVPLTFITYGSLPAGTNVPAGSYSDTVIATVTY